VDLSNPLELIIHCPCPLPPLSPPPCPPPPPSSTFQTPRELHAFSNLPCCEVSSPRFWRVCDPSFVWKLLLEACNDERCLGMCRLQEGICVIVPITRWHLHPFLSGSYLERMGLRRNKIMCRPTGSTAICETRRTSSPLCCHRAAATASLRPYPFAGAALGCLSFFLSLL